MPDKKLHFLQVSNKIWLNLIIWFNYIFRLNKLKLILKNLKSREKKMKKNWYRKWILK